MSDTCELEKLNEWVSDFHRECNKEELVIAEIGSYKGKTAALLAQYGTVFAIDLWGVVPGAGEPFDSEGRVYLNEFQDVIRRLDLLDRVYPIIGTSVFLSNVWTSEFDLIFVDGDHTYASAKKDLENAKIVVSGRGLIIVHDYKRPGYGYPPYDPKHPHHGPNDPWGGVAQAVDEFIENSRWEIAEHYEGIVKLQRA